MHGYVLKGKTVGLSFNQQHGAWLKASTKSSCSSHIQAKNFHVNGNSLKGGHREASDESKDAIVNFGNHANDGEANQEGVCLEGGLKNPFNEGSEMLSEASYGNINTFPRARKVDTYQVASREAVTVGVVNLESPNHNQSIIGGK